MKPDFMRAPVVSLLVFVACISFSMAAEKPVEPRMALTGLDPVELVAGKGTPGLEAISVVQGKYRYLFANTANRAAFQKDPERYAVQFGGSCMKMGPLSGGGAADRYYVHDQRIYLFASESCRDRFKADPERFVDKADSPPAGSEAEIRRAAGLMDKAIEGIGGAEALKNLSSYEARYRITSQINGREFKYSRVVAISFPDTYAQHDDYGTSKDGWVLRPEAGYLTWERGEPVENSVRQYMIREFHRHPLAILKAWQRGEAKAVALGAGKVGETPVQRVAVGINGATSTLSLEPASGRILQMAYRGRVTAGISQVEKTFSDFRKVGGALLPFQVATAIDGKPLTTSQVMVESIRVNEPMDVALLARPN